MPNIAINHLPETLKSPLQNLYVIHGEEDLLRIEAVDALRNAAKSQGYLNRETFIVENVSFDWSEVLANVNSIGLFADLKLLEIHIPSGKPGLKGGEALLKIAEKLPENTVILLVFPKLEKTQLNSKWFTALAKYGVILEAKAINTRELPQWINHRLQQYGLTIDTDALTLFTERVEGNLLAAKQELDKLGLLYTPGHQLTINEITQNIANVARFDVFQLSAAWMEGNVKRLIRLLDGLESETEEPIMLVWTVADDLRTLIRLTAAFKQGKTIANVRNELRLWGDKQRYAPLAAQRLSPTRLINALQECAKIDRQIKGVENGNAWNTFKNMMLSLAT